MYLGPCAQYAPIKFAAAVLKFASCTILVFASGTLVVVSAQSEMHSLYMSQLVRTVIESVPCVLRGPNGPELTSLLGATVFERNATHNIVGHGFLGSRLDLKALRDANPQCVKYIPDLYPAAKCDVWITADQQCHCKKQQDTFTDGVLNELIKPKKCSCIIKCLCYDSGKIVMPGAQSIADINNVFMRMKRLSLEYRAKGKAVPKEERFYERLGQMMATRNASDLNQVKKKRAPETKLLNILDTMRDLKALPAVQQSTSISPLMKFAEAGQLKQVQDTLAFDRSQLYELDANNRSIIDRLNEMERTELHEAVLRYLLQELKNDYK